MTYKMKSAQPKDKFEDYRRGDAGRDGGGIYRHIARDTRIPNILTKGDYSTLCWREICASLYAKPGDDKLKLNLIDSAIVEYGEVLLYLYTNVDGTISKKPAALHSLQKVRDTFIGFLEHLQPQGYKYVALCHTSSHGPNPLDIEAFNSLCMGAPSADVQLVQVYVPSKGNANTYLTFRVDYWLDRNARSIAKCIRLGVSNDISGSKNRDSTVSMNKKANEVMESATRRVVNRVEKTLKCKVVRLSLDFVEDVNGKIWLVHSTECLYAVEKVAMKRTLSPENRKTKRNMHNTYGKANVEFSDDMYGLRNNNSSSKAVRPLNRQLEEASFRRRGDGCTSHVNDDKVHSILREQNNIQSSVQRSRASRLSPVKLNEHQPAYCGVLGAAPAPTSTLSYTSRALELPGTFSHPDLDTAMFGSSQLRGCAGDFCNFDLSFIENKEVLGVSGDLGNSGTSLSDFRRKLLEDTTIGDEDEDIVSTASVSNDVTGAVSANTNTYSSRSGKLDGGGQNPSIHDSLSANGTSLNKIPFRIIIQTRQEMPLVNNLLKKIRRRDNGKQTEAERKKQMYVTEDNYGDLCVSGKLPSHYYKDVDCCSTCFKVYKIIIEARASAIRRIEKKREKAKRKSQFLSDQSGASKRSDARSHIAEIESENSFEKDRHASLQVALRAVEGLTKLDVAEIRTMSKPPAAVEVVMEAVIVLLTGKTLPFQEARRLLGGGEAFLLMLREFQLENVTDSRLRLIEPYVDNPVFRPENVQPISYCASKFCAWVLGVVQAARWQRGIGHKRSDLLQSQSEHNENFENSANSQWRKTKERSISSDDMTFVQKLQQKKAKRGVDPSSGIKDDSLTKPKPSSVEAPTTMFKEFSKKKPPSYISRSLDEDTMARFPQRRIASPIQNNHEDKQKLRRQQVAMMASQKRSIDRLSSQNKNEGNLATAGVSKEFRCFDGITKMPYTVMGNISLDVSRCNFIVVHDFFDTHDATAIAFKPLVQRHSGCQVFCFNYPGQSNTVWPRPSAAERERGAKDQVINNIWIADRINELLQHAENNGDILLTNPFHLIGIGNGASIAAAFALRYGKDSLYSSSLRSLVSVNGFLYPDPQLSAVLHSASQVFETTPHSRPDIPVSYWSRFVFSEDYLARINPNLALNIYTAVSNPITNDGRAKIARGCLKNIDLRGSLNPNGVNVKGGDLDDHINMRPVQIPVIVLQSTENSLVSAANVDPFLNGRIVQHLWSHQQNIVPDAVARSGRDPNAQWVGGLSHGPEDYPRFSILGKNGLKMLLNGLKESNSAFVMWTRAGHALYQENKTPFLDLLDALANPSESYYGLDSSGDVLDAAVPPSSHLLCSTTEKRDDMFDEKDLLGDNDDDEVVNSPAPGPDESEDDMVLFEVNHSRLHDHNGSNSREPRTDTKDNSESNNMIPGDEETVSYNINEVDDSSPDQDKTLSGDFVTEQYDDAPTEDSKHEPDPQTEDSGAVGRIVEAKVPNVSSELQLDEFSENIIADQCDENDGHATTKKFSPLEVVSDKEAEEEIFTVAEYENEDEGPVSPLKVSESAAKNVDLPGNHDGHDEADDFCSTDIKDPPEPVVMQPKSKHPTPHLPSRDRHVGEHIAISKTNENADKNDIAEEAINIKENFDYRITEMAASKFESNASELSANKAREERIVTEQEKRRRRYEAEDEQLLSKLDDEMDQRAQERERADRMRRLEMQNIEQMLVSKGIVPEYEGVSNPVPELPDMRYGMPSDLPAAIMEKKDVVSSLDKMIADEDDARKKGIMSMEQYEEVKQKMVVAQMDRDQKTRHMEANEQEKFYEDCGRLIQRVARGYLGRVKANRAARDKELQKVINRGVTTFQSVVRGCLGRQKAAEVKRQYLANLLRGDSIITIQRIRRGFNARKKYKKLRQFKASCDIQRAFRGYIGRSAAGRERARLATLRKKERAASKIQSTWKMKVAREEFRSMRIHMLAAIEMQRMYRGYLGRKKVTRRREWETATPGPERIKLGLKMIEESKVAFERQQEEIDALHRAQERAEARVSHIHAELKDSEKELVVLERELQEIDQIERDLQIMTHERDVLANDIQDAAGMPRTAMKGHETAVLGQEPELGEREDSEMTRRKKAEAYALELTIQIKRAEREKKRQELETEFASVFQEVEKKRKALERLESSLADMESTRERKDREFRRLQKNLMQLLLEQKEELDDLREKGIQLETASATTAAAATATALKAKEHEKKSTAMFSQTEELMKFQFMSMSLSYFSSLNMLNQLRDMNSETTAAAVSSSADSAAAAAAASTAANLPKMKKLNLGADDFVSLNIQKKKAELAAAEKAEKEVRAAKSSSMPTNVALWSVDDVTRWLESLSLGQYVAAFKEATVDGAFLMELREEDLVQVLGVSHKLHVRKIMISREKLRPLTKEEVEQKERVEAEDKAEKARQMVGVPDLDTVFSQARNGRLKRLEESLNLGFPIESEDSNGNTLLLVAAANSNRRMVEMLVVRGAKVNHQNSKGQTALHFSMAFDKEGLIAEYLIQNGADDTLENVDGLTPYDGIK